MTSTQIFLRLFEIYKEQNLKWQTQSDFEIVVGAILVQNTTWKNVQKAILNLKNVDVLNLEGLLNLNPNELATLIKPSGFYNTKAKRIVTLLKSIKKDFTTFENFKQNVSREWLLGIKGVGEETCDSILCYACNQAQFIGSSYALRILEVFGYEFECYNELKEWLGSLEFETIYKTTNLKDKISICKLFHLMIIEFCKEYSKGKKISEDGVKILNL